MSWIAGFMALQTAQNTAIETSRRVRESAEEDRQRLQRLREEEEQRRLGRDPV